MTNTAFRRKQAGIATYRQAWWVCCVYQANASHGCAAAAACNTGLTAAPQHHIYACDIRTMLCWVALLLTISSHRQHAFMGCQHASGSSAHYSQSPSFNCGQCAPSPTCNYEECCVRDRQSFAHHVQGQNASAPAAVRVLLCRFIIFACACACGEWRVDGLKPTLHTALP
jgi:hypothetical protein